MAPDPEGEPSASLEAVEVVDVDDLDSDPDTSWMPPGQSARSSRSLMAMWVGGGGAQMH